MQQQASSGLCTVILFNYFLYLGGGMFAFDIVSMTRTQFCKMSDRSAYHNDIPAVCIS